MIKKVVIPAAGLGTRLLPATKDRPKEMLPIFVRGVNGRLCLKPLLQVIFENLYDAGFREFGIITAREKRSIVNYFTPDYGFVEYLESCSKLDLVDELRVFYEKIQKCYITFINQPKPKGLGDAVYRAKPFIGEEPFLVHAGDELIISSKNKYLTRLLQFFERNNPSAAFIVEKVRDPRNYGVIAGEKITNKVYRIRKVVEKPSKPSSNIAIVAVYIFDSKIFRAIEQTASNTYDEVQLTNAIQHLIDEGYSVYGVELDAKEKRFDIGTPISYYKALRLASRLKGLLK